MKNNINNKNVLHNIRISAVRREQVNQGFFDGRYRTRAKQSSKIYNRKKKDRESPFSSD